MLSFPWIGRKRKHLYVGLGQMVNTTMALSNLDTKIFAVSSNKFPKINRYS